jgi:hypothetical protein
LDKDLPDETFSSTLMLGNVQADLAARFGLDPTMIHFVRFRGSQDMSASLSELGVSTIGVRFVIPDETNDLDFSFVVNFFVSATGQRLALRFTEFESQGCGCQEKNFIEIAGPGRPNSVFVSGKGFERWRILSRLRIKDCLIVHVREVDPVR